MRFNKGDIIEVYFELPYLPDTRTHPAIIISNEDVYHQDHIYICVMMTSNKEIDEFTFEITQDMLVKPNNKDFSQARCHLITYIMEDHVVNRFSMNQLKNDPLERLLERIIEVSF